MYTGKNKSKGYISILALFFVAIFTVLAMEMIYQSRMVMVTTENHNNMVRAQAAAESGLNYVNYVLNNYMATSANKTFNQSVTDSDGNDSFDNLYHYLSGKRADGAELGQFTDETGSGQEIILSEISLAVAGDESVNPAAFTIRLRQYTDNPQVIVAASTGRSDNVDRTVEIGYAMVKDTRILDFTIASRSRIIVTGDSTIEGGIFSEWGDYDLAPPITLAGPSTINGDINTVLSQDNLDLSVLNGTYDEVIYDQPPIDWPESDDFDTSWYEDQTKTLSSGLKSGKVKEYFPHAPGDYSMPYNVYSTELNRTLYEDKVLTNVLMPSGSNALFKKCTFKGVLYIKGGIGVNNIRFEDCTFEGVIVTGRTPKVDDETWKKNLLYFTGTSIFDNQLMDEMTILAPNYNVNIGNTQAVDSAQGSTIKGMILGGVVDVRGNITLNGSIISMANINQEDFGSTAQQIATNIGFSSESREAGGDANGTIAVIPQEDKILPIGFASKVMLLRDGNSYVER